jgi:hypothetical protein
MQQMWCDLFLCDPDCVVDHDEICPHGIAIDSDDCVECLDAAFGEDELDDIEFDNFEDEGWEDDDGL